MTLHRFGRTVLVLGALALGACVYYPSIKEIGGIRIQPANGRLVRDGDRAVFYAELLGWQVTYASDDWVVVAPSQDHSGMPRRLSSPVQNCAESSS